MSTHIELDFAYAIFRNIHAKNHFLNRKANKSEFLTQCILEFMHIQKLEYLIIKNTTNVVVEIEDKKIYFWIVEIPELSQETEYIEYLCKELILNFYFS